MHESALQNKDYVILIVTAILATTTLAWLGIQILQTPSENGSVNGSDDIDPASIAVLAFVNMSPDPENEFLADGISEELLNALTRVEGLRVSARTSSFSFKNKNVDIPTIGRQLKVATVLEGSVRMSEGTIRITAQLIDGKHGTHRWSQTYDRPMRDVLEIQDEIALDIVSELRTHLDIGHAAEHVPGTTRSTDAYSHYLRGRALSRAYRRDSDQHLREAIAEFNAAIEVDRDYGDAYVALVDVYALISSWHDNRYRESEATSFAKLAESAANAAILVAPNSSEALRVSGEIGRDVKKKERAFRQSLEVDPNNIKALTSLAAMLRKDNLKEALDLGRLAQMRDPLSYETSDVLAELLWLDGRFRESSDYWRLSTELKFSGTDELRVPREEYLQKLGAASNAPQNLDFRSGKQSWELNPLCDEKYAFSIESRPATRRPYASILSNSDASGWCNIRQAVISESFVGKYVRLNGVLKSEEVDSAAYMFLKAVGINSKNLSFANGEHRPMRGDQNWMPRSLTIYIPREASMIQFGVVLNGKGRVNIGSMSIDVSDSPEFN